jgi:hypothetical protein
MTTKNRIESYRRPGTCNPKILMKTKTSLFVAFVATLALSFGFLFSACNTAAMSRIWRVK